MQQRWFLRRFGAFMCGVILSGTLLGASLVDAATYYVATSGNDSNPGTSGSPFRTINRGAKALKPGDTLRVKSGTYAEALIDPLPSGPSASQPTTIEGDPSPNRPVLRPTTSTYGRIIHLNQPRSHVRFRNLVLDGTNHLGSTLNNGIAAGSSSTVITGLVVENCDIIGKKGVGDTAAGISIGPDSSATVRGCSIHGWRSNTSNPGAHGFYWRGRNGLIENNTIYDNNGYGIQFYTTSNSAHNNIFRNNYVHSHDVHRGIYCCRGSKNQIYNNLLVNNSGGIWFTALPDNHVWNNTIYNNRGVGIEITGGSGTIRNNIVYQNGRANIAQSGGSPTLSNNLTTDPKFVNAAGSNFRLQSSSPAINKGITLSTVGTDFDGTTRPQGAAHDIGAFEYTSSTPAVSAPANLRMTNAK